MTSQIARRTSAGLLRTLVAFPGAKCKKTQKCCLGRYKRVCAVSLQMRESLYGALLHVNDDLPYVNVFKMDTLDHIRICFMCHYRVSALRQLIINWRMYI